MNRKNGGIKGDIKVKKLKLYGQVFLGILKLKIGNIKAEEVELDNENVVKVTIKVNFNFCKKEN